MRFSLLFSSFLAALILAFAVGCTPDTPEELERPQSDSPPQVTFTPHPRPDTVPEPEEETVPNTARETAQAPATAPERQPQTGNSLADLHDSSGPFSVQVAAHRNEYMAKRSATEWNDRGFAETHVVRTSDEGDTWYYVFLGRYSTFSNAERAASRLNDAYNSGTWPRRIP